MDIVIYIIIGIIVLYKTLDYFATKPLSKEKMTKLLEEESELHRELTVQEMLDRGYTTNFKVSWAFFKLQCTYKISELLEIEHIRLIALTTAIVISFVVGLYIGTKL